MERAAMWKGAVNSPFGPKQTAWTSAAQLLLRLGWFRLRADSGRQVAKLTDLSNRLRRNPSA